MMMSVSSGAIIPAPWFNWVRFKWVRFKWICVSFALVPSLAFAAESAIARLGKGVSAYDLHDYSTTTQSLKGLQIPKLPDYTAYYLGYAQLMAGDTEGAVRTLDAYRAKPVESSPLAGKLAVVHARALIDLKQQAALPRAIELLKSSQDVLPQPEGTYVLGTAYEAAGDRLSALFCYRKVYYGYPGTEFSTTSQLGLERLRVAMGSNFSEATPGERLERARHMMELRDYRGATAEYTELAAAALPDAARDEARAGLGAAEYMAGDNAGAFRYLKSLRIGTPEEDARRLYYLTEAARRLNEDEEMLDAVRQLGQRYSTSQWRLKALLSAGNRFIPTNEPARYTPLFRDAFATFAADGATAAPHWKLAWDAYLAGNVERIALLKEQIARYPRDSRSANALYYLGRSAWTDGNYAEARAWYERASQQFPHYYYAVLARERMTEPKIAAVKPDPKTLDWLDSIDWPSARDFSAVVPNKATQLRVERARILMSAGLTDLADAELRFGARSENEQPHLLALELARSMPTPFNALRIMKSFSTDYLSIPFESAPLSFWQMLFPLPYRDDIERTASANGLDPFSVAGLIRQETEFNPTAASHARAYGLMQLVLPTGREMGRKQGIPVASSRTLFEPSTNIRLGTAYLKQQLGRWNDDWTQTLAAYNAGPTRVRQWLGWGLTYHEPAEFIESIPFTETRDYVQAVLRNADMYRQIYGQKHPNAAELRDTYDVPAVNLSSLPRAARIPGGGVKTATPRPAARRPATTLSRSSIKPAAAKPAAAKPAAKSKAVEAKKKPAPKPAA